MANVTTTTVGDIPVRMHGRPPGQRPVPLLLWIHGGGYVMGTAHLKTMRRVGTSPTSSESSLLRPNIDLLPSTHFHVPCMIATTYSIGLSNQPHVDSSRVAVGGGSAGGGLAASLTLLAHERDEIPVAFQLLAYPMLGDDRIVVRTDIDGRNLRMWNNKANRFGWRSYTGLEPGRRSVDWRAQPAMRICPDCHRLGSELEHSIFSTTKTLLTPIGSVQPASLANSMLSQGHSTASTWFSRRPAFLAASSPHKLQRSPSPLASDRNEADPAAMSRGQRRPCGPLPIAGARLVDRCWTSPARGHRNRQSRVDEKVRQCRVDE